MRGARPISPRAWRDGGRLLGMALVAMSLAPARAGEAPVTGPRPARFREPVALGLRRDGTELYVANRRSGTLSVIDSRTSRVRAEYEVGRGLADLAVLPDGNCLLAVDQAADALLLLDVRGGTVHTVERQSVSADPVAVAVLPDGSSCVVASRWSRRLSVLELAGSSGSAQPRMKTTRTIDLPFSPRNLAFVRDGAWLVAADAFEGRLAVVDPRRGTVASIRSLPAHNIRGMAVTPDGESLLLAHQVLLPAARTTYEDIHWGLCINNDLRVINVGKLLGSGSDSDMLQDSRQLHLGDPGNGSGDPSALAFDHAGHVIVALGGIDEVLIGTDPGILSYRPSVGRRPTAVAIDGEGRTAYVANSLDDSISVIDIRTGRRRETILLGPCPEPTPAERGRRLFSFAGLSHGGWMSCQSCHTDGHSNGQNSDTLGDGDFGAPKRVPSLFGVAATGPWGWDGRFERLEDQVRQSIESTMQGQDPSQDQVADLVAYLRTLGPLSPRPPAEPAAARGRAVFQRECATCHAPPSYTSSRTYDVGIADEAGNRRFNPPSLRGVWLRTPLLHDGRARSLEDVLGKLGHPLGAELTGEELADLVAFLKSL